MDKSEREDARARSYGLRYSPTLPAHLILSPDHAHPNHSHRRVCIPSGGGGGSIAGVLSCAGRHAARDRTRTYIRTYLTLHYPVQVDTRTRSHQDLHQKLLDVPLSCAGRHAARAAERVRDRARISDSVRLLV